MSNGFSRAERLLLPSQFQTVYRTSRAVKREWALLYKHPNSLKINRLGISISNKICPNIVLRNRCKRIIREVFRAHKSAFGAGNDCVVVVKKFPKVVSYEAIAATLLGRVSRKNDDTRPD